MTIGQTLIINQGETWSYVYTYLDNAGNAVDLTGYSARMSIKDSLAGGNEAYLSTGADANGGTIVLGASAGTITLSMTATQSSALAGDLSSVLFTEPANRKPAGPVVEYIYDLEIISGSGAVTRVLEGNFVVKRQVTS